MNHRYDIFKKRRAALELTLEQVREKTGLAKGTILLSEKREGNPHASTLKKLAKCYRMDPSLTMNFNLRADDVHSAAVNGAG